MKAFVFVLVLSFIAPDLFGQIKNSMVTGNVIEDAGGPIPAASVSLMRATDTFLVKIIPADAKGRYQFDELNEGSYFILVSATGYKATRSAVFSISPEQLKVEVPPVKLLTNVNELGVVEVKGTKPLIEVKADRMIFNVAASMNATGSNALELLGKSPMVRVDNNNISVNGKYGVAVYIDGRPTNLSGNDLATILTGIPSANIESIEVITNPSARYPAAGNAGIINIRMKKSKDYGFNGSASATAAFGHTPKYDGSLNLNYRKKAFNLFGNYGYQYGDNRTIVDFFRQVNNGGTTTTFDQHATYVRTNDNHNYKGGIDFFLSRKSTLGVLVNGSLLNGPFNSNSNTSIYRAPGNIDSVLKSGNKQTKDLRRVNYNVNYQYQGADGRTLNIDGDYTIFRNDMNSLLPNAYETASGGLLSRRDIRTTAGTDIGIGTFKADYEQKFLSGKLGAGVLYNGVKTQNDFQYFNYPTAGKESLDSSYTRGFHYNEKVGAAYLTYSREFKNLSFQIGMRGERTNANGSLTTMIPNAFRSLDTTYFNLFPNGAFTYTLNKNNTMGISYSRRIDRPSYEDLNPFITPLDELTLSQGNTFLRPQYTDNYQLTYRYKQVSALVGYSVVKDFFTQVLDTVDGNKSIQTVKNIPFQYVLNFTVTAQYKILDWWSTYGFFNVSNTRFKGDLNNAYLNVDQTKLFIYDDNSFDLSKGWVIQLSGYYNGPSLSGTTRWAAVWTVDGALQKKLFQNNGSVKLQLTDIFNSLRPSGLINYAGTYLRSDFRSESRQLKVSMNYRFGSKTVKQSRKRSTAADAESKRLKDK